MSESWDLIKDTASRWLAHKDARLGAALAYYSVFSLGPLIVIAIAVAGLVLGQEAVRGEVGSALGGLLGESGALAVNAMLVGASKPHEGIVATVVGVGTLLFAAIGVVVQLKDALNTVWEVKDSPISGGMELHSHVCPVIGRHPRGRLPATCLNADDSGFGSREKASCPLLARSISSVGRFLPIVRHHQLIVRYDVQVAARHTCCLERRVARRNRHRGTL